MHAPLQARQLVERHVCAMHGQAAVEPAQVLVSELATCAVLYGKPPIVLDLECGVSQLRLGVTHRATGSLVRDIPVDEAGGLRSAVLSRLSRSWGVERAPETRRLWSAVPTGLPPEQYQPPNRARARSPR
jgi:hypothetical protein